MFVSLDGRVGAIKAFLAPTIFKRNSSTHSELEPGRQNRIQARMFCIPVEFSDAAVMKVGFWSPRNPEAFLHHRRLPPWRTSDNQALPFVA